MFSQFFEIKKQGIKKTGANHPSLSPGKFKTLSTSQQSLKLNISSTSKDNKTKKLSTERTFTINQQKPVKKQLEYTHTAGVLSKELKQKLLLISQKNPKPVGSNKDLLYPKPRPTKLTELLEQGKKNTDTSGSNMKTPSQRSLTHIQDILKKPPSTRAFAKNFTKPNKPLGSLVDIAKKNSIISLNEFTKNYCKLSSLARKEVPLEAADGEGCKPVHFAAWHNNIKLFEFLLAQRMSFDHSNKDGITPLMLAALKGHSKMVALLANMTSNINACDNSGNTALHYAVVKEHLECVKLLLANSDIIIDIKNGDGKICIDLAHPRIIVKLQELILKHEKANNVGAREVEVFEDNPLVFSTNIESYTDSVGGKVHLNSFIIHSRIGQGSFGEVYLVEKRDTNMFLAMKVLSKQKIFEDNLKRYALTERNVLSAIDHPFIVKLRYAFQNAEYLFLVMDYCPGSDLGEYLEEEGRFTEQRAKMYMSEVLLALEELHKHNIIFRDLKPENIILDGKGHAMLIDFGLSKEGVASQNKGAKSFCGSVAYLAPEMVKKIGHGKSMDWYLLGVVLYELLVGIPPFYAETKEELFHNIEHGKLKIPSSLSPSAKDLLIGLLQRSPNKRLGYTKGADEIKAHPWFFDIKWNEVLQRKLKPPMPTIKKVQLFQIYPQPTFVNRGDGEYNSVNGWTFIESNQNTK